MEKGKANLFVYLIYLLSVGVVIAIMVGDYLPDRVIAGRTLGQGTVVLAGLLLSGCRLFLREHRSASELKTIYSNTYQKYVRNAFSKDPKLEKAFFRAVDDYNRNRPAVGLKKLEDLLPLCRQEEERYAVTVFQALCCHDMDLYDKAAEHYHAALQMRPDSTLASNMGLCCEKMGDPDRAVSCYLAAVELDENNAMAYNNLSQHFLRAGDPKLARTYALLALQRAPQMRQALTAAAISSYMLGDFEAHEDYYRRAVCSGADGSAIKKFIADLNVHIPEDYA